MPIIKNIAGKRVLSADGTLLGVVESVEGERFKLAGSKSRSLPATLITNVEGDEVHLASSASETTVSGGGTE